MPKELTAAQQQEKFERTQAKVGLASNALGITAGSAALGSALSSKGLYQRSQKVGAAHKKPPVEQVKVGGPVTGRVAHRLKSTTKRGRLIRAGLVGAAALQAANLGGDIVANRVLSRSAKGGEVKKNLGASIIVGYESPRADIGYGVSLLEPFAKAAYYDSYDRELARQRAAGRNQAVMVGGGGAALAAAPLLYRSAYKKPERKAIRSARANALARGKGRIAGAAGLAALGGGLIGGSVYHQGEKRKTWR